MRQIISTEEQFMTLSYKKAASKLLMKFTPGAIFTNMLTQSF